MLPRGLTFAKVAPVTKIRDYLTVRYSDRTGKLKPKR
jgi:hypothetical protein